MYLPPFFLGISAAGGLAWIAWQAPEAHRQHLLDAGLSALAGALLGGRAIYVAVNWYAFAPHPLDIPQVWLGGFSGVGALAGALAGLMIFTTLARLPLAPTADSLFPLLAALSVAGWLTCWLDGVAYGQPVDAWWALPAKDEWGIVAARWPVQLAGMVLTSGIVLGLYLGRKGLRQPWLALRQPGLTASLGLLGVSLEMLGLSFLRADPMPAWRGLRLDTWGGLGLIILVLPVVIILLWQSQTPRRGVSTPNPTDKLTGL